MDNYLDIYMNIDIFQIISRYLVLKDSYNFSKALLLGLEDFKKIWTTLFVLEKNAKR